MTGPLLEISHLQVSYQAREKHAKILRGIDLQLNSGEVLALTGESGSGKTTVALAVAGLLPPYARVKGQLYYRQKEVTSLSPAERHRLRGKEIALIFQDPQSALNPVLPVGKQVAEVIRRHQGLRGKALARETAALFRQVGMAPAFTRRYPFQLSGGECQRVMIASAVAGKPSLLIADEPTSDLDLVVQERILNLLQRIQREYSLSLLLISHDLGVIARLAQNVAVLYDGQVVEHGSWDKLFTRPSHPYTKRLFAAVPRAHF